MAQRSEVAVDPAIATIEEALVAIVRTVTLPATQERFTKRARVPVERSGYPLLRAIGELGPLRLRDLARDQRIDPSTVSRQVAPLEALGLVRRDVDPTDARAVNLVLTREGRQAMERFRAVRHRAFQDMLRDWTTEERETLAPLLTRLAEAVRRLGGRD